MPGFTTHYLFGLTNYKLLKNAALKKSIFDRHAAFSLGLQGPDVFFYYLPSYVLHENNIGSVAHIEHTNLFLSNLMESRKLFPKNAEEQTAQAYIAGFLGHYILDCHCHPYVYYRTHYQGKSPDYFGSHVNLEVDIDTELLSFYKHKLPSSFSQESTIRLKRPERRTIAIMLYYAYSRTYPGLKISRRMMGVAIKSMQLGTRLLHDSSGKKKVLVRKLETLVPGYPLLSPMIASDFLHFYPDPLNVLRKKWKNPWDLSLTSKASFFDLMEQASGAYQELMMQLQRLFTDGYHTEQKKMRLQRILKKLGNNSYHSGLPL